MSDLEKMLDEWRAQVHWYEGLEAAQGQDPHDYKSDLLVVNCVPRFKFFRPPMWRIFRWAYKVQQATLFQGVYPVAMRTSIDPEGSGNPEEFTMTFNAPGPVHPVVEQRAEELKKKFYQKGDDDQC